MLSFQTDFLHWNARLITDPNESVSSDKMREKYSKAKFNYKLVTLRLDQNVEWKQNKSSDETIFNAENRTKLIGVQYC